MLCCQKNASDSAQPIEENALVDHPMESQEVINPPLGENAPDDSTPPPPIEKNPIDGFYHPESEQDIVALVTYARNNKLQLRVRGSSHSVGRAIYTDKCSVEKIDVLSKAPPGNNINVKMDKYIKILELDESKKLVTVEAGIHLGHDPIDPLSNEGNSLLYQLHQKNLTLPDLGGITHQTVAGFLSTGSSGGTLQYGLLDNVQALRIVTANGENGGAKIITVSRTDADQSAFKAALVSMGVLGVLSAVTIECTPTFNIKGCQTSKIIQDVEVDLYDDNPSNPSKIGLSSFLQKIPYTRMLWWPQTSEIAGIQHERIQIWQAERIEPESGFKRKPFRDFENVEVQFLSSYLMTLMGNIEYMDQVKAVMNQGEMEKRFHDLMEEEIRKWFVDDKQKAIKAVMKLVRFINEFKKLLMSKITSATPAEYQDQLVHTYNEYLVTKVGVPAANFNTTTGLPLVNYTPAEDIIFPNNFGVLEIAEGQILSSYMMALMTNIKHADDVKSNTDLEEHAYKSMTDELETLAGGIIDKFINSVINLMQFINGSIMSLVNGVMSIIPAPKRIDMLPTFSALVVFLVNKSDGTIVDFHDYGYLGLPMDNGADDIIFPTMFTEIWIPLPYATKATKALRAYFGNGPKSDYAHTGNYAWELYACKATDAWMSMAYSDGSDDWKDGCFRIDPFWFLYNAGEPDSLFRPVWVLLHEASIPFRLHWAKEFPSLDDKEYDWRKILVTSQYSCLSKFLDIRKENDPDGIFLSSYWRYWLSVA